MANKKWTTDTKEPGKESGGWRDTVVSVLDAVGNILPGKSVQQQNKQRIYTTIAQFIQKQSDRDLVQCLSATYILCQEDDRELLRENPPTPEAKQLAEIAKKHILTIKLHCEKVDVQHNYLCQTEIYYLEENKPIAHRVQERVKWDDLPDEVREQMLKTDNKKVSLKLFPQE